MRSRVRRAMLPILGAALLPGLADSAAARGQTVAQIARAPATLPTSGPPGAIRGRETLAPADLERALQSADRSIQSFYAARAYRPLWVQGAAIDPAGSALLALVEQAQADAIKPGPLKVRALRKALDRARGGTSIDLARAEASLSRTFVAYVKAMRAAPRAGMDYESPALAPVVPTGRAALDAAAASAGRNGPSLGRYIQDMGWMHPLYAGLRRAVASGRYAGETQALLRLNLERIRAIPAHSAGRHVLVDAANARLVMYEGSRPVGSMRVVVGTVEHQTPMMAGFLRYAQINPYWNVPPDLVQKRIARNVLDRGLPYLKAGGYQILDGWGDDAQVISPTAIDWAGVATGLAEARVRQLPGRDNFMGKVKFMFPNAQGIYLHDTPDRGLLLKDERQFSSGCVRLEDAARLGKWLFGKALPTRSKTPEQRIDLPEMVPVYITYLTASIAPGRGVTFAPDVYGRDRLRIATRGKPARPDRAR